MNGLVKDLAILIIPLIHGISVCLHGATLQGVCALGTERSVHSRIATAMEFNMKGEFLESVKEILGEKPSKVVDEEVMLTLGEAKGVVGGGSCFTRWERKVRGEAKERMIGQGKEKNCIAIDGGDERSTRESIVNNTNVIAAGTTCVKNRARKNASIFLK